MFPDPATLTAHRAPALLVDAVLACSATGGQVRLLPVAQDVLQVIEGCAQAIAVLQGARSGGNDASRGHGFLIAASDLVCQGPADGHHVVHVTIIHGRRLGQQQQHHVVATSGPTTLVDGTLTTLDEKCT